MFDPNDIEFSEAVDATGRTTVRGTVRWSWDLRLQSYGGRSLVEAKATAQGLIAHKLWNTLYDDELRKTIRELERLARANPHASWEEIDAVTKRVRTCLDRPPLAPPPASPKPRLTLSGKPISPP